MNLSELNNLDINNVATWPLPIKITAAAFIFAGVIGLGWYLDWDAQAKVLANHAKKETDLRTEFETKQKRAANLDAYKQQLAEMQDSFGNMLRQLPSKAEVSKLLVDVSQTGLASGLEFELFKPANEIKRDFYAELPVKVKVKGSYDQFARFVSGVANLPRIVTLHDIGIQGGGGIMTMELTAKTYWYTEDAAAEKKK